MSCFPEGATSFPPLQMPCARGKKVETLNTHKNKIPTKNHSSPFSTNSKLLFCALLKCRRRKLSIEGLPLASTFAFQIPNFCLSLSTLSEERKGTDEHIAKCTGLKHKNPGLRPHELSLFCQHHAVSQRDLNCLRDMPKGYSLNHLWLRCKSEILTCVLWCTLTLLCLENVS